MTAIYRERIVSIHIIAIIQAILLWCVAMSLYWISVHILGKFRINCYIRSLVASLSPMYGSLTHFPLIMQNVTYISHNTGFNHCLVTWRQETMAHTNVEYKLLTWPIVHFYGKYPKKELPANSINNFIWYICMHTLGDYELTCVYGSLFTFTIYIYIRISPYIICTITWHFDLKYLALEHTLITFMPELPINYEWVFNSPSPGGTTT